MKKYEVEYIQDGEVLHAAYQADDLPHAVDQAESEFSADDVEIISVKLSDN